MVVQIKFEYSDRLFEWKHKDFISKIPQISFSMSSPSSIVNTQAEILIFITFCVELIDLN